MKSSALIPPFDQLLSFSSVGQPGRILPRRMRLIVARDVPISAATCLSVSDWARMHGKYDTQHRLQDLGIPCAAVQRPEERIDRDPNTSAWGMWPTVTHSAMGEVRVDGIPVHMSKTDWQIERGAPCLGEHNDIVFGEMLGMSAEEIAELKAEGVL